jgi:hypothetical protein
MGENPILPITDIGGGLAVSSNPGGKFHGWLFRKHPDGQYVSVCRLEAIPHPAGPLAELLGLKP